MLLFDKRNSFKCAMYSLLMLLLVIPCFVDSHPTFFSNPFGTVKPASDELGSISVYTTSQPTNGERRISDKPTIYQEIARNTLQRIVSPVIMRIILAAANQNSRKESQLTTTTNESPNIQATSRKRIKLEDLNDNLESLASNNGNKEKQNQESDGPEKIVVNLDVASEDEKIASEVDDLNKPAGNGNRSSNRTNEVDSFNDSSEFEDSDEDDSETAPETTTPKSKQNNRNFSETGLIYILELLGTVYTLGVGIVSALIQNPMKM